MSVQIKYNQSEFFNSNGIKTPFIERSAESLGEIENRMGFTESFILVGQIKSDESCDNFEGLRDKQENIIEGFSENFKKFEILENSNVILEKDFVKVSSIVFEESNYVGIIGFSITLEVIDEKNHNNFFGVKNPVISNEIKFNKDKSISVKRSVSSVGINTQDGISASKGSSLNNAINFVKNNSQKENVVLPEGINIDKLILLSESETINRTTSQYSVDQEYISDATTGANEKGLLRYTVDIDDSLSSINTVSISGNFLWGINNNFSKAREKFKEFNLFELTKNKTGKSSLVSFPISEKISEDISTGSIQFSATYDDDKEFNDCGVANKVNYSINNIGEKISISVSGEVLSRGPSEKRFNIVKNEFYQNIKNKIYEKANLELSSYYPPSTPTPQSNAGCNNSYFVTKLKETPSSFSITENEKIGKISYQYEFSSSSSPEGFNFFNITSESSFPVPRYSITTNAGGSMDKFIVSRSGFDKASISISCSASHNNSLTRSEAISKIKDQINLYFDDMECSVMRDSIAREKNKKNNSIVVLDIISEDEDKNTIEITTKKEYYDYIV